MLLFLLLLGFLQGVTEFIPISSSGHLAMVQNLELFKGYHKIIGSKTMFAYDVFIHFSTLLSIIIFFHKDLARISRNIFLFARGERAEETRDDFQLAKLIIFSNIPIIIIGLLFKDSIEALFQSSQIIYIFFIANGIFLISTIFVKSGDIQMQRMGIPRGLIIGIMQCFAILPGVSRSGSTIGSALFLKVKPDNAARFSFLLGLPAISGAALLEFIKVMENPVPLPFRTEMFLGMAVAFLSGLLSLKILMWLVRKTILYPFGLYTLLLGLSGLFLWYP